jgi:uncharacterized membrane protein YgdD (TMEM256/DUF423 family)
MHHNLFRAATIIGATAIIAGAFGAHALKSRLDVNLLATFETAARYQFYHALALGLLALNYDRFQPKRIRWVQGLMVAGLILFCGSLYALCLSSPHARWLGAITPFGGGCFITAWVLWGFSFNQPFVSSNNPE